MATTMNATAARASLPEILDRVEAGDEVTITRHGRPVAIVRSATTADGSHVEGAVGVAVELRALLEDIRRSARGSGPGLSRERGEQLIAEIRADRDRS